ncbi:acyclic terpene utilization AtuA family protein, partial [Novipirellula sp.]|uniref:acyclic terpene utilization AtuA family protein n=1 Tax=Novipirellula sp. TaxID=2795430 RepID=UPI003566BF14
HLIECGTQVTGGISTDWMQVPDPAHLGFPIVQVDEDGHCVVTKPANTGGQVTPWTVKEQLVYEIGDPENYLSPDVTVSFRELSVEEISPNQVHVRGAIGKPPPSHYKVSATFRDGFRSAGMLTIVGRGAPAKARRAGEIVLERLRDANVPLRNSLIECLGKGACFETFTGKSPVIDSNSFDEVVLRLAVEVDTQQDAERFARELMPLVTAGPQGTTGYSEGRPRIHPVIRYWPCLISRDSVQPIVESLLTKPTQIEPNAKPIWPLSQAIATQMSRPPERGLSDASGTPEFAAFNISDATHLHDIAIARSGDKGSGANIGVIARNDAAWKFLQNWLTAERVATFFSQQEIESIERFELANLQAFNFVIRGILRHGLRTDTQGKTLGQIVLEMPLPKSVSVSDVPNCGDNHHGELDS